MPPRNLPSIEFLRECFHYNPSTGELRRKISGKAITTLNDRGYYIVGICGVMYRVHRIIWKMMTGEDPPDTLDHIDGNRTNNRWSNLRTATHTEQKWNARLKKSNTSGFRGVSFNHGRWQVKIRVDGIQRHFGRFDTAEEAAAVYKDIARKLHGEFYREN